MPENNENRITLGFRVDPDWLKDKTCVPDPVSVHFTGRNPFQFMDLNILGGSGLTMFFSGAPFEFTRKDAQELIKAGFARDARTPRGET